MSAYRSTFISHAHADNALCDRYVAALRACGVDVWYDRENAQNGHLLGDVLARELERRPACVVLLTQNALDSFWVNLEIQTYLGLLAQDRSRVLLPVRIAPCTVPPMLNAFLWIDALDQPFERAIEAIVTALTIDAMPPVDTTAPAVGRLIPHAHLPPSSPPPPAPSPAPAPQGDQLMTPPFLHSLGFRVWRVTGVECVLPPLCPVPGGEFPMGSDQRRDPQAEDDELPQLPVWVDTFSIAQHPVTVGEYACAVRAKAVPEPPQRGEVDWQTQLGRLDSPVVCVSWHHALAYTRWLATTTGQPWRLPTEAEWEKAARGTDGRLYPWGDAFDNDRCNTSESGIGTTTHVGRYPNGASPYGAHDMAGNVWEWVSSHYKSYPYRQDGEREALKSTGDRVLRGGSWLDDPWDARAACRNHLTPVYLYIYDGFRLAWSAPAGS